MVQQSVQIGRVVEDSTAASRREHAQEPGQSPGWGHLRHGETDAVGRSSGMVKVTLLALMSQHFQLLLSPTGHGSFRNNSSIIDIHAPFSCP